MTRSHYVEIEIDLTDFSDEELIEELELRNSNYSRYNFSPKEFDFLLDFVYNMPNGSMKNSLIDKLRNAR